MALQDKALISSMIFKYRSLFSFPSISYMGTGIKSTDVVETVINL